MYIPCTGNWERSEGDHNQVQKGARLSSIPPVASILRAGVYISMELCSGGNWYCKDLMLRQGQYDRLMSATPPEAGWCAVHSTPLRLLLG